MTRRYELADGTTYYLVDDVFMRADVVPEPSPTELEDVGRLIITALRAPQSSVLEHAVHCAKWRHGAAELDRRAGRGTRSRT